MNIIQSKRAFTGLALSLLLLFATDAFAPLIGGSLAVRVVDSLTGTPITTATVDALQSGFPVAVAISLGDGIYFIPQLTEGEYSVEVSAFGFQIQTQVAIVSEAQVTEFNFDLLLITIDNTIFVTIPLAGTDANLITNGITVTQAGTPVVTSTPVLLGSTYVVTGIPPGNFLVSSNSLAYEIQSENVVLSGDETEPVELSATSRVTFTGTIGGAVVFQGGSSAVPNALILVTHLDTGTTLSVNADVDGIFALPGVTPGPVELQAFEVTATFDDPAGASIPIELEVPSGDFVDPPPIVEVLDTFRPGPLNVWVDFAYEDVSSGLFSRPYSSIAAAILNMDAEGTLLFKGDTSISDTPEMPTLSKPMTFQAIGGAVRVGTAPPARKKSRDELSGFRSH